MEAYILPEKLKPKLREIWGVKIFGKKSEISKKFKKFLKKEGVKKIITVGDFCSLNLPSDVKIFDGKIQRKKIKKILKFSFKLKNPPGTIQKKSFQILKKAIKEGGNVFVEGEEDLLVIPAVLLAPVGSLVVYGFFQKGICLIKVDERMKDKVKRLLFKFEEKN